MDPMDRKKIFEYNLQQYKNEDKKSKGELLNRIEGKDKMDISHKQGEKGHEMA